MMLRAIILLSLLAGSAQAGTLEDIHARGTVQCGVSPDLAAISMMSSDGYWQGMAIDFCKALSGAVLGKPGAIAIVPLIAAEQLAALQAGDVDVLIAPQAWSFATEANSGTLLVAALLHGTSGESMIAPVVRQGDDGWFVVVRWTLHTLLAAEAQGVTQAMASVGDVSKPWMSGDSVQAGKDFGLAESWPSKIIAAAGHYGEIHARHFGVAAERGLNRLARDGGLMFAPLAVDSDK